MPPLTAHSDWTQRFKNPVTQCGLAVLGLVIAGAFIPSLFDLSVFRRIGMAHEYCYLREPRLIWLHVISDLLIGLAYVSISATLAYLVLKASRSIPFQSVFLAFGLFIVSCGLTHFMEVWVIWEPVYWMSGYVKLVTAVASVATAIMLFPLVPKVFAFLEAVRKSEQRRIEIEQLNGELERFNYSVVHDLRAPLRGIRGFGQALREDCSGELSPQAMNYIEMMQRSAALMDSHISNLLKYASVRQQKLERTAISLNEVMVTALAMLESDIRERKAVIDIPKPLPAVMGDATLLQVVLVNLISNAIKFVAPGITPRVEITAWTDATHATVLITDNGLGIPREALSRLFQMFERHHPEHPGSGIGLAMAHRAVERLGGKIGVEPALGGTGTRAWFQLPIV